MSEFMEQVPEALRPYEKCLRYGVETLSDEELLAVLLRTGTKENNVMELAKKVLDLCGGSLFGLYHLNPKELRSLPGIGKIRAIQIQCLAALAERTAKSGRAFRPDFSSPAKIAGYYMEELRTETREILKALFLDTKCRLISEMVMSRGSVNASIVPVREIFAEALAKDAVNLILLHNHPSGDASPSEEDIVVTRQIGAAGNLIGVKLQDHIVIGDRTFFSMREKGMIV